MRISHSWLASYMLNPDTLPSPSAVENLFTMRAFEVESVEVEDGDTIYDIKILPDRSPYAYGIRYIALELSLLIPELIFNPKYMTFAKTYIDTAMVGIEIDETLIDDSAKEYCTQYTLTKIENINNYPSPVSVVQKLKSLGQQSRGIIVDLTNLVMYDTGQPLHAFDADKIIGKIRVRKLETDTEVVILGGKKVQIKSGTLVIKDDEGILAIAGVKGCVKAEVSETTKNIYLESALFDRVMVRKASRNLNIINDSSKRFEQGLTSERFLLGIETFIEHLKIYFPLAIIHPTKVSKDLALIFNTTLPSITIDVEKCIKMIDISDEKLSGSFTYFIENILPKTGAEVDKGEEGIYRIIPPLYRTDLTTVADVITTYMRYVGYEVVPYRLTEEVLNVVQDKEYGVLEKIRNFLVEKGYTEVLLHTLVDSKKNPEAIVLENSLTSERDALRNDLSSELLTSTVKNFPYLDLVEKKIVELFEIGTVHFATQGGNKKQIIQKIHLALSSGMPKWPKKIDESRMHINILHELCEYLSIDKKILDNIAVIENENKTAIVSEIDLTDVIHGIGNIIEKEIDLSSKNSRIKSTPYRRASIYPPMSRDIAFFVEGNNKEMVDEFIKSIIQEYELIETHSLFDVFSKEDKTSYGYRFVFQSYEKTLTEEEVSKIMIEITKQLQAKGWVVR